MTLGSDASFPGLDDAVDVRRLESPLSERMWLTSSSRRAARISPLSELCVLDVPENARVRQTDSLDRRWMARICGRCGSGIGGTSGGGTGDAKVGSVGDGDAAAGVPEPVLASDADSGAVANGSGSSVGG